MSLEFVIRHWAACAPGLLGDVQWRAWAAQPWLPAGECRPGLAEMPALLRRRLDPLGRMAAQVAYWCQQAHADLPMVFASRYGDAARSVEMLAELAREQALSPTVFGLSVHNAIAAMVSIARGERGNVLAVAAGAASAAAALVEAGALLADGAPEVLVVCYDAALPGAYAEFADEPGSPYAWAWRVARPAVGEPHLSLDWDAAAPGEPAATAPLPFGLDLLRFALSPQPVWSRSAQGQCWTWRRHG